MRLLKKYKSTLLIKKSVSARVVREGNRKLPRSRFLAFGEFVFSTASWALEPRQEKSVSALVDITGAYAFSYSSLLRFPAME